MKGKNDMALDAITAIGAVLLGYGVYSRNQQRRKAKKTGSTTSGGTTSGERPTTVAKVPLVIGKDCSSWEMPETWILQTAEPRFRSLLDDAMRETGGDVARAKAEGLLDPVGITYWVLHEEIGSCPEPIVHLDDGTTLGFDELQSEIPDHPDYYPYPAILGLFSTIYEGVVAAIAVLEETGDPARALLFPV